MCLELLPFYSLNTFLIFDPVCVGRVPSFSYLSLLVKGVILGVAPGGEGTVSSFLPPFVVIPGIFVLNPVPSMSVQRNCRNELTWRIGLFTLNLFLPPNSSSSSSSFLSHTKVGPHSGYANRVRIGQIERIHFINFWASFAGIRPGLIPEVGASALNFLQLCTLATVMTGTA